MTFADHFSTVAARYASYRPHYPPALAQLLAERSPARGTAWDAGCGNGQLSAALADHFEHVIATDPSQAQLDEAARHPRIEYRCASAEVSGLADASVDLAVAAQAAHWFDWPRYRDEVARVARPGALIGIVSYGIVHVAGTDTDHVLEDFYRKVVGPYWPSARKHVENGYRDLAWSWPTVDAPAIEMTARWTREELTGYVTTWSSTVKLVATEGSARFEAFCERLLATWPDGEPREVRWPLAIRLARR
ncbi:MAG: SAM-dependent methyltransferase [Myxococcales bacterium]|nr:SAM-dependent methyltransferase [Myxococcales bacterium]